MNHAGSERDRFVLVLFYGVLLLTGYLAFRIVGPFLAPLGWAAVFAMVLNPIHASLARRQGEPRASTVTTVLAFFIIVGPAITVLTLLVAEITPLVQRVQSGSLALPTPPELQVWYEALRQKVPFPLPADLTSTLADGVGAVATFLAGRAGSILQNVASFVFQLFVMMFGLFYFLRDGDRIVSLIRKLLPFEPATRDRMIAQTHELVVATVGSTFAVAIAQGALTGLALGLLGIQSPVFWGVATSFFSLLPVVGSGIVWAPAAIYLFITGHVVKGVILVAFGVGVIGMADNVLRPLLLSGRTTMHGLLVFVSLLGGMAAFGFIGLVIGPVAIAAIGTLLDAVLEDHVSDGPEPDAE
ncbi:MAG: AI-2E family transporter [Vicinamibacterales bacterium]